MEYKLSLCCVNFFEGKKKFVLLTVQTMLELSSFANVEKTVAVKLRNSFVGVIQCFVCVG